MTPRRVVARGLSAVEGPVVGPNGWVLNVNSFTRPETGWPTRGGDITATHRDRPGETRALFNTSTDEVAGIPAALAFGPDGCLYVTDEGRRAIVRVQPDGTQEDFVTHCGGERLNGPNDLSFDPDGNLWFTDPWGSSAEKPIGGVCCRVAATGEVRRIDEGLRFPNGIVVRGGRLYYAETFTRTIWLQDVVAAGRAANRRRFALLPPVADDRVHGPDGVALDADGNLYVAYYGGACVCVFDERGQLVERLDPGGENPTNVCFGGAWHDELYVTVDDTGELVALELGVPGERLAFCPSLVDDHPWSEVLPPP